VQPFGPAAVMVTVRAVNGEPATGAADPVAAALVTVTQEPTVTSARVPVTVLENVVDELKFTVTCPVLGFWTSRLVALTAAAVPNAPGGAAGAAELELDGAEVELAEGVEVPPQATRPTARAAAISARPDRAPTWRRRRRVDAELVC